jgi:hypothetical protein
MRKKRHPLSGAIYEDLGNGRVRVEKNGLVGIFEADGRWVEGDLTFADLHMLVWVGGKELPPEANYDRRRGLRRHGQEIVHD